MRGPARFSRVHWILMAFLAVGPTSVFAQEATQVAPREADDVVDPSQILPETGSLPPAETKPATETALALADRSPSEPEAPAADTEDGPKVISGMSILGNQEAPTSLVIVPWKSSRIGDSVDVSTVLDDSRQPVDKDVFMRELRYYEIRSETSP